MSDSGESLVRHLAQQSKAWNTAISDASLHNYCKGATHFTPKSFEAEGASSVKSCFTPCSAQIAIINASQYCTCFSAASCSAAVCAVKEEGIGGIEADHASITARAVAREVRRLRVTTEKYSPYTCAAMGQPALSARSSNLRQAACFNASDSSVA